MSARLTILLGVLGIVFLGSVLAWLQITEPTAEASEANARVAGMAVASVDGIDHVVERYTGPVGYFTVEDQLAAIGITLYPEDRYLAIPDPSFGVGSAIEITRATPITIVDAGQATDLRTWRTTVSEALGEVGRVPDDDDRVEPSLDTALRPDLVITLTRVDAREQFETEEIAFRTVTKQDPELEKGKSRVAETGRVGLKKLTYAVTEENGAEIARRLVNTEVVREPVDKVIFEGTKTISYGSGEATWYALKTGLGAAHNTLPKGTRVKVTNLANGKTVDVVINDHGIQGSAVIDLTAEAFQQIAPLGAGRIRVKLEKDYD